MLLARAPAPGKRGGTGWLGDPGRGSGGGARGGRGWGPGTRAWPGGPDASGPPPPGPRRRPRAGVCRSGRRSPAEPLEGRGCRVPASPPARLGPQRSAGPSAARFSPRGQASKWRMRASPSLGVLSVFFPSQRRRLLQISGQRLPLHSLRRALWRTGPKGPQLPPAVGSADLIAGILR